MNIEVLTTSEAAQYLRLGKPTLDRFRITGEGPNFCKLGGAVRYRRADLDNWLESRVATRVAKLAATQSPN
jgi:excisionase family DNA binding protein